MVRRKGLVKRRSMIRRGGNRDDFVILARRPLEAEVVLQERGIK